MLTSRAAVFLTGVKHGKPSERWMDDVRAGRKPGPNETQQIWHYSNGDHRVVRVGAEHTEARPRRLNRVALRMAGIAC